MSSSLKVALKVICIFIAYLSLISCVSARITYSLTTADIRRNCMRSEFTLFTQSCDVRQCIRLHYGFIGNMMMDSFAALYAIDYCFGTIATMLYLAEVRGLETID